MKLPETAWLLSQMVGSIDGSTETRRSNVVVVAPFSPRHPPENLGADKKIALVIGLLHRLGHSVHLVDSSHSTLAFESALLAQPDFVGDVPVILYRPACLPNRKLGKLANVFSAAVMAKKLVALRPKFVWIYNSYAYEARLALALKRMCATKIVLELEDMPLARYRGLNIKPWLDHYFLDPLLSAASLITCVNAVIKNKVPDGERRAILFPSLVQHSFWETPDNTRFRSTDKRVGYFGGLEAEKGAHLLLELLPMLPTDWKMVVTGVGSLTDAFVSAQQKYAGRIEYHGRVSNEAVTRLMSSCDAIVNPHSSSSQFLEGVFPFKVCEAIASGALLVTTPLPSIDFDLSRSVLVFDGTAHGLASSLGQAENFYSENASSVAESREYVRQQYSEEAVFEKLRTRLDQVMAA